MGEKPVNIKSIFGEALEKKTAEERAAYLDKACGNDANLRTKIETLLKACGEIGDFLEVPAPFLGKTIQEEFLTEGPGTRIGRYKLLQMIGEGGFGVVYMAQQEEPIRRKVALKIIKLGMDTKQVIARFEAERQALAMMEHPNIAKVLDAGATDTGRPYFVMELVKGIPITDYCDKNNLDTRQRLNLFIDVCKAVQHAHQKGIIHRDIKPSNVMITLHDGKPVPKIIDFGIAKATQHRLTEKTFFTEFKQFIGTPEYMSPEQAELSELDVDTRSDIYSLGVLLYELLAGRTPLEHKKLLSASYDQMLKIIRETEPPKPSACLHTLGDALGEVAKHRQVEPGKLCKIIQGDLDWIVLKTLEKDRTRRYETANGLAMDIGRHLRDEPVVAGPPSAVYRMKKFVRRNRTLVTGITAVAVVVLAGFVVSTAMYFQAEQAKTIAQEQHLRSERFLARVKLMLASAQLERGVKLLNEGDSLGLLDLIEAWNTADEMPSLQDSIGRLWAIAYDLWSGRLVHVPPPSWNLAFSPNGRLLATTRETTAQLWNMETGQPHSPPLQLEKTISAVVFSPDGKLLATHSLEGVSQLWDPATGQAVGPTLRHDGGSHKSSEPVWDLLEAYWSAAFSSDGKLLATASLDGTVQMWETDTGQTHGEPLPHGGQVWAVAFSPDGKLLASGSTNKTVQLWDVASARPHGLPLQHEEHIKGITFSPNGKLLATGAGGPIYLWKTETGQLQAKLEHQRWVNDMTFSPDGNLVATASADRTAQLWDPTTGKMHGQELQHNGEVLAVTFSPDGSLLATTSRDQTTRIWEVASGKPYGPQLPYLWYGWKVAFSPDSKFLASSGGTRIWRTDLQLRTEVVPDRKGAQPDTISPDGKVRAIISGNEVQLWDVSEDRELGEELYHEGDVRTVRFSPDGKLLAAGTGMWPRESTLRLWDVATRKLVWSPMKIGDCYMLVFSPDGKLLVVGSGDWRARVFEVTTGRLLHELISDEHIYTVAFRPDGKILATGSGAGTVEQWNMATGRRLAAPLRHQQPVWAIAYSPDGNCLSTVSGVESQTVRIWNVGSGQPHHSIVLPVPEIQGQEAIESFSSDGTLLVSRNADRTKRVWRLPAAPTEFREMQLRTWVALGAYRDLNGKVEAIPWDRWQEMREELHSVFMQSGKNKE